MAIASQFVRICTSPGSSIPDGNSQGVSSTIHIDKAGVIQDLDVYLRIDHTWVGDLEVNLTNQETGMTVPLVYRPKVSDSNPQGCSYDDIGAIIDDEITLPSDSQCASGPAAVAGIYRPEQPLSQFDSQPIQGNWVLRVIDNYRNDTGRLTSWCVVARVGSTVSPTPNPPAPSVPSSASLSGFVVNAQKMPLSCESQAAVDWARWFRVRISENEFFSRLPKNSDNPDKSFVGSVYGTWGQIPPNPYGVHAEPVAIQLRKLGLSAYTHRPLSFDVLRAEVAAGRPVIVWTIGPGTYREIPVYYKATDGETTIVAHYEHALNVIGYSPTTVTLADVGSGTIKTVNINTFLASWSALGNMAITTQP